MADELTIFVFVLMLLGIWIASAIWAYEDANRRGKSGCLVSLLVLLFSWPFGLLIWLIFRPQVLQNKRENTRPFPVVTEGVAPRPNTLLLVCDQCNSPIVPSSEGFTCTNCSQTKKPN
jgi:hypothetical protein